MKSLHLKNIRNRRSYTTAAIVEGVQMRDRMMLGRAITLIESTSSKHQEQAQEVIQKCLPLSGNSFRIGVTGTPGVGKSTFIESFGKYLIEKGHRVAVLAIDPSSQASGGSILGDKTRMEQLSILPNAFVRPSPAADTLGGVARKTRETILLCEAAGYDIILIETVGVGQSEISVHSMVDFFLLLLLPGAGDELQGIKRGIVEMAHMVVINKADGERIDLAKKTKKAYRNSLHLFPAKPHGWTPDTTLVSALNETGIDTTWSAMEQFQIKVKTSGYFYENRKKQSSYWLKSSIEEKLQLLFYQNEKVKKSLPELQKQVLLGDMTSFAAADKLMEIFLSRAIF